MNPLPDKSATERRRKIIGMQALVDEALNSGPGTRTMQQLLEAARRQAGVHPRT